jgi:hypothetical protein
MEIFQNFVASLEYMNFNSEGKLESASNFRAELSMQNMNHVHLLS